MMKEDIAPTLRAETKHHEPLVAVLPDDVAPTLEELKGNDE